jgi:cell wall-associated NlpC family hydrolase
MRFRLLTAALLLLVLAPEAEAQRTRGPRKKPFQEFSESAQRLKDSVAVRIAGTGTPASPFTIPAWDEPETRDSIVNMARSQIGARYILGAQTPGKAFDCSGLVRFVMSALRIELPRTANEQAQRGAIVAKSVDALRVGDLLTFGLGKKVTHIGIYVGEGRFVHASVTARKVVESRIDKPGNWYSRHWMGARRLLAATIASDSLAIQ